MFDSYIKETKMKSDKNLYSKNPYLLKEECIVIIFITLDGYATHFI